MSKKNGTRFVLVTRKTRLQELVERFNTWSQAEFYLEHNGVDVSDYLDEHDEYQKQVFTAESLLKAQGRFQQLERGFLPNFNFRESDIIVVIGQDGLVANTMKYLKGNPVIAINPSPQRWDGKLLPFQLADLPLVLADLDKKLRPLEQITFAEAVTNDGQRMIAVNDLFIGPKSHTSARYTLTWNNQSENQSSSGIIVSTGLGSTGWFQSILAGAMAVTGETRHPLKEGFTWGDDKLMFAVREPFPSNTTGVKLAFGEVGHSTPLTLESTMPENGVVFSDGVEADYLSFNSGCILKVKISKQFGKLIT